MKHLVLFAAGLGWNDVERHWKGRLDDLVFSPVRSVFPAVTCPAQATLRTGLDVRGHGMVSNGAFLRALQRPLLWEQSARLVEGRRIWADAREQWAKVAVLFFQQSLGEEADVIVSPAPVHRHDGGAILGCHAKPAALAGQLEAELGPFPLHRYWGPLASPKAGDAVARHIEAAVRLQDPDIVFAYLPTLDYDLQRFGPDDARCRKSFRALAGQLRRLAALAAKDGASLTVVGDYAITPVAEPPAMPNRLLRRHGFFEIRSVKGMAYPDFYSSRAFAMADHEIAHVFVRDPADVPALADLFAVSGDYSQIVPRSPDASWGHPNAGELLLVAKAGSWCAYPWWEDAREAPDFAAHVDIHSKPGYDPCELFLGKLFPPRTCQDAGRIRGTHGRRCETAYASTVAAGETLVDLARSLQTAFARPRQG